MKTFHLTIARIGEKLFDAEAVSASVPGAEGMFEILGGHEPFISELRAGEVRVRTERGEERFAVPQGGIAEVSGSEATILL
ncbi:MAG TPA: F0F1 ATP synthase subunit epsilon [Candidatus Paceibacterota bacterium]|nr:F0F1 ATP synthase subunit epsilon [Candidatus Paceibacterota bacterium]